VWLALGSGILDVPLKTKWGNWWLDFPILLLLNFGTISSPDGTLSFSATLPNDAFPPIPLQSLLGDTLSNPLVLTRRL
jgi:hypothetical protein